MRAIEFFEYNQQWTVSLIHCRESVHTIIPSEAVKQQIFKVKQQEMSVGRASF